MHHVHIHAMQQLHHVHIHVMPIMPLTVLLITLQPAQHGLETHLHITYRLDTPAAILETPLLLLLVV